jgi:hypothetical protein
MYMLQMLVIRHSPSWNVGSFTVPRSQMQQPNMSCIVFDLVNTLPKYIDINWNVFVVLNTISLRRACAGPSRHIFC